MSPRDSRQSAVAPSRRAVLEALLSISKTWPKPSAKASANASANVSGKTSGKTSAKNPGSGREGKRSADGPGSGPGSGSGLGPDSGQDPGPKFQARLQPGVESPFQMEHGAGLAPPQAKFFGGLDARDRALAERLYRGVLQNLRAIDLLLVRGAEMNPKRTRETLQWVLRLAVYQHIFLDHIPPHALVHQSVELGREFGGRRAGGYVNAMLRRLLPILPGEAHRLPEVLENLLGRPPTPAELYSVPDRVARLLEEGYGKPPVADLLKSFNGSAPRVWLRVNSLKTDADELREKLAEEGVLTTTEATTEATAETGTGTSAGTGGEDRVASALRWIPGGRAPWTTQCWERGELTVQDTGAMLAAHLLNPAEGEAVLDWCAAPGGKTGHLWELMGGAGRLTAVERNGTRRRILEEALERLYGPDHRIEVLSLGQIESSDIALRTSSQYQVILLDVPCLGLGLLGRHPEARWDGRAETIPRVTETQRTILGDAVGHLASGGRLLWATCSPTRLEVEEIILPFIESRPELRLVDLAARVPGWARPWVQIDGGILRTRPDLASVDGFAYAMLERVE